MNYLWWLMLGFLLGWYAFAFSVKRKAKKLKKKEAAEQVKKSQESVSEQTIR